MIAMRPRESQGNLSKDPSHSGAAAKRPFSFTNVRQKQPPCQRGASDLTPFFLMPGGHEEDPGQKRQQNGTNGWKHRETADTPLHEALSGGRSGLLVLQTPLLTCRGVLA